MAFTWNDIQIKEKAYSVRNKLNSLGQYSSQLVTTIEDVSIPVASWVEDTTYAGYNFKATVNMPEVQQSTTVFLMFSLTDQLTNNYGGGETGDGVLTVYAITKPAKDVVIPNVVLMKGGE